MPVKDSTKTLERFHASAVRQVQGIVDACGASDLPVWVKGARQVTDGHLVGLANSIGATLATLDGGIVGAFLIPDLT